MHGTSLSGIEFFGSIRTLWRIRFEEAKEAYGWNIWKRGSKCYQLLIDTGLINFDPLAMGEDIYEVGAIRLRGTDGEERPPSPLPDWAAIHSEGTEGEERHPLPSEGVFDMGRAWGQKCQDLTIATGGPHSPLIFKLLCLLRSWASSILYHLGQNNPSVIPFSR